MKGGRTIFSETGAADVFKQFLIFFGDLCFINESCGSICCVYLVPDFVRGVHDVPKERVDCCVGYQDINASTLIQSLFQTQN